MSFCLGYCSRLIGRIDQVKELDFGADGRISFNLGYAWDLTTALFDKSSCSCSRWISQSHSKISLTLSTAIRVVGYAGRRIGIKRISTR
jgi:hypothetical protein